MLKLSIFTTHHSVKKTRTIFHREMYQQQNVSQETVTSRKISAITQEIKLVFSCSVL